MMKVISQGKFFLLHIKRMKVNIIAFNGPKSCHYLSSVNLTSYLMSYNKALIDYISIYFKKTYILSLMLLLFQRYETIAIRGSISSKINIRPSLIFERLSIRYLLIYPISFNIREKNILCTYVNFLACIVMRAI